MKQPASCDKDLLSSSLFGHRLEPSLLVVQDGGSCLFDGARRFLSDSAGERRLFRNRLGLLLAHTLRSTPYIPTYLPRFYKEVLLLDHPCSGWHVLATGLKLSYAGNRLYSYFVGYHRTRATKKSILVVPRSIGDLVLQYHSHWP